MPKFCHACGAQLFDENAKFCSECGVKTTKELPVNEKLLPSQKSPISEPVNPEPAVSVISESSSPKPVVQGIEKTHSRGWGIIAIVFALIIPILVNSYNFSAILTGKNIVLSMVAVVVGYIVAIVLFIYGVALLLKS